MLRWMAALVVISLFVFAALGMGIGETRLDRWKVLANDTKEATFRFRGGERACVIAVGDHNPRSPTDIRVLDAKGRLVTESKSPNDSVAAIWYPPVTASYRIEVENHGDEYNIITVYFQGAENAKR